MRQAGSYLKLWRSIGTAVGDTMRAHEMISVGEFRATENMMTTTPRRLGGTIDGDDARRSRCMAICISRLACRHASPQYEPLRSTWPRPGPSPTGSVLTDRDDYRLACEHFCLDLQLFWQRSNLYLLLNTAAAPDTPAG